MALVAIFLVFRKRYGPGYTIRNFIRGLRPERDRSRETKTSSVPVFIDRGLPQSADAITQRRGTRLQKPKRLGTGRSSTNPSSCMMTGAVVTPDQSQSQAQTQPIEEPAPARSSRQRTAAVPIDPAGPNRLSIPSVTTWSSYLYLYSNTPPPLLQQQGQQQEHDNHSNNSNSNKAIVTTPRRKQPPSPLGSVLPNTRIAIDNHLRALTPASPCSNRSHFTTTTQSSGPLPSIYQMGIGRDPSRASITTANGYGYGDCRWSYCQNYYNNHAGHSVVGSEDRIVSLPSPSPMLRNTIRPPGASPVNNYHVYQMMRQSPNGGEQQAGSQSQSQSWEIDSYHRQQENDGSQSSHYGTTEHGHVDDNGLPILPRSVFARDT